MASLHCPPRSTSPACEVLETRIAPAILFAVTSTGQFLSFDSSDPSTFLVNATISGLQTGERIEGLDIRPATGDLYALGIVDGAADDDSVGRIYRIDKLTGAATPVGVAPFSTTLEDTTSYGFDFNPVLDHIRVVTLSDGNMRVNPNDGMLIDTDTDLMNAAVASAAYDHNYPGATATTLYGIDVITDQLVRIGGVDGSPSPDGGALTPIGPTPSFGLGSGFDIGPDGTGYLAGTPSGSGQMRLLSVNLSTGESTDLGLILQTANQIRGLAVDIPQITIAANGRTASYTDVDGDRITVKTNRGTFDSSDFVLFSAGAPGSAQLSRLLLSDDGEEFIGANITIAAKRTGAGDGFVNVGWIDSTGFDLGHINVKGDLGKLTVGDGITSTRGLGSLTIRSLGVEDISTQGPEGSGHDLESVITGGSGAIKIAGDVRSARFDTRSAPIASLTIGGDLVGGDDLQEAYLFLGDILGAVTIKGNVFGGNGSSAGTVSILNAKAFILGGHVYGGLGSQSGNLNLDNVAKVQIGGDLVAGRNGGLIIVDTARSVTLNGSILGADNSEFGILQVAEADKVTVKKNVIGGDIDGDFESTAGAAINVGRVKNLSVGGSVIGGIDASTGNMFGNGLIQITDSVDNLTVKGSLIGNPTHFVTIAGRTTDETPVLIKKLTVGGDVTWARILVGYSKSGDFVPADGDGSLGSILVKGDWSASSIIAGIQDADENGFGNLDDIVIAANNDTSVISRIASITIKGGVSGSSVPGDRFAFTAEEIGSITIGGRGLNLSTTQDDFLALPTLQSDVFVREV
jgi:hypothetical protein